MESTTNVSVSDQAGQEQLTFLDLRGASDADLALLQRILTHSCKVQLPVCEKPEQPVPETCRLPPDGTEYDADEAVPRAAESPPPPQPPPPPQQPQPQQQQQQRQRTPIVPPTNQPGLAGEMPSTSPSAMPTMSAPHQMMAHMMHGGAPMFHPQAAPGYYPGMFMPPGGNMMYQMSPAGYPMAPAGYGAPEPPAAAEQGDRRRSAGGKKGGDKQLSALAAPFPGPGFAMTPRAATGQPLMIQPFPGHPYGAQYAQYPYPLPYGYGGYATYPSGEMVLLPPPPPHHMQHMQQHPMEMPVQPPPGAAEESRTPLCEPYGRAEEEDVPPVAEDAPAPEADADPAPAAELEPPPVSDSPSATAVSIAPSATAGRVETAAAVVPEPAPTGPVRLSFGFNLDHKLLIGENSAVQLETSGVTPEPTEERAGDGRSSSAEPTETAPPTSYVATVTVSQRRVIPPPEPVDFGPDSGRDSPDPLPEPDRLMGSPESEMMISPEPAAGTDSETAETPEPYPTNGASSPEPLPEPELDGIEELEAAAQAPAPVPAPAPAPAPAPVPAPAQPAARSWASLFSKKTEGAAPAPVAPATPKPAPAPPVPETDKEILALGEALARFELCHKTVYLQPRGLTNKSNWCYINAVLQALVSCTPFYHLMKSLPHNVGVLPDRSRTPIIDAMVEFIREFSPLPELPRISRRERERGQLRDIQHGAPFEPGYVYAMLSRVSSDAFRVAGRQEDAEEFLTCLLSGLQDEMTDVLKKRDIAVTVARSCVGIWHLKLGKLLNRLADQPLGAIVTHAEVTKDGSYIVNTESGNLLIWDVATAEVLFRTEEKNVKQLTLFDHDTKFITVCKSGAIGENKCVVQARTIPDGERLYRIEYPIRLLRNVVVTSDNTHLVLAGNEALKDTLFVYNATSGTLINKIVLKYANYKDFHQIVVMPNKPSQVALIDSDKGNILDVRTRRFLRSVPRWNGSVTRDGKYGLFAPARGGLEVIELRHGTSVRTLIPRVAEGVFSVITRFTKTDRYVLYYHSGSKTIRVFRMADGQMVSNYRVSAELTAIDSSDDGTSIVLGTVDGCLTCLTVADPKVAQMTGYVTRLPSRSEEAWRAVEEHAKEMIRFAEPVTPEDD